MDAPTTLEGLPPEIVRRLDGGRPMGDAGEALVVSTVDAAGWPHAAHLSEGEVLVLGPTSLRACMWPGSTTTANLRRDGRCTLSLVSGGAVVEARLRTEEAPAPAGAPELAYFRATVESVRVHRAKYAEVTAGVAYRLRNPAEVHARWAAQIDALRRLG